MGEHLRSGVGTRRIDLGKEGNGTVGMRLAHQLHGHCTVGNVDQFMGLVHNLGVAFRFQFHGEKLDHGHWNAA
ncbi:hypothetical protein D3C76_1737760 [compost metagenome]